MIKPITEKKFLIQNRNVLLKCKTLSRQRLCARRTAITQSGALTFNRDAQINE